jgi:predicted GNAT superfamily acetyltransferase
VTANDCAAPWAVERLAASTLGTPTIKFLESNDECLAAAGLLAQTWGTTLESAPISSDLIRSMIHAGGCAVAAMQVDQLIGLAVAVAGPPRSPSVYSLIAAVDRAHAAKGTGRALKEAQRVWALERGATTMVWTFDPLIRRNAHFNLNRLGAEVVEFYPSFYPPMYDAINRNDLSDRLVVSWDLSSPQVDACDAPDAPVVLGATSSGEPQRAASPPQSPTVLAGIPADIEGLRIQDPGMAARWRAELRDVLATYMGAGYHVAGLTASGNYVLRRLDR